MNIFDACQLSRGLLDIAHAYSTEGHQRRAVEVIDTAYAVLIASRNAQMSKPS